jgi:hypothetical protein
VSESNERDGMRERKRREETRREKRREEKRHIMNRGGRECSKGSKSNRIVLFCVDDNNN